MYWFPAGRLFVLTQWRTVTRYMCVIMNLPYSGKFSRVLIFTVFADRLHSVKIKTSKFEPSWPLCDSCAHIANFSHTTFSHDILQTAGVRVRSRLRWLCWSILLHRRRLMCMCTYANTWPVYGCDLGHPWKLKCENIQSNQFANIFTLEYFLLYGTDFLQKDYFY